jgi:hypothetical protein
MTFLLSAIFIFFFFFVIPWLADRPSDCPKCGMRMGDYDAKHEVCVNPYCVGREAISPRIHREDR